MKITDSFYCKNLSGTMAYSTCLKRQKMIFGVDKHVYIGCNSSCSQGLQIRQMFPDYDMEPVKRTKNIALKPGNKKIKKKKTMTSKLEIKNHISKDSRKKDAETEKINLEDIELLLKAQITYILDLAQTGRLDEAVNRLKLIAKAI